MQLLKREYVALTAENKERYSRLKPDAVGNDGTAHGKNNVKQMLTNTPYARPFW